MNIVTASQLADWLKGHAVSPGAAALESNTPTPLPTVQPVVLDVREDWEHQTCHLPGSLHIPMGDIPNRLNEIDELAPVVCLCHHGVRSYHVALYLQKQGFENVYNLQGGIHAWSVEVDPECPQY